jgi:amino-acid N-acetyltransferase
MPDLNDITLRPATDADVEAIANLLKESGLPISGVADFLAHGYVLAESGGRVVGAAGVESYNEAGLLRSVVVSESMRGTGLGRRLVVDRIDWAERNRLHTMYLLTETAPAFFSHLGFEVLPRDSAPDGIRSSSEFSEVCPESAVFMARSLSQR